MMRLKAVAAIAIALAGVTAHAQATDVLPHANLQWKEIVPGASFAAAYGDWEKGAHGKFVMIKRGAEIPMHVHSNDYRAVMVSGRMANLYDGDQRVEVAPGDYFSMAAKRPHSHECLTEESCLFYTYSDALWDIEVVEAD